jgi:DNA-binding NarL/FixJ family response regulator
MTYPGRMRPSGARAYHYGVPFVTSPPMRVIIADDQALLRGSFRLLVESAPGMTVVGEASNGTEAIQLACDTQPDVALMDVRMPGTDGIAATREICARTQTRVLILTMFDNDELVYAALRAGASGFLLKDTPPADLLSAINVIAQGEALLDPAVTRRLIADFVRHPEVAPPTPPVLDGLTQREREVLTLVARGQSNMEIAARLSVSLPTVKTHVGRLLAKLAARDRTQLVIAAYETGLVSPHTARRLHATDPA